MRIYNKDAKNLRFLIMFDTFRRFMRKYRIREITRREYKQLKNPIKIK